jgi:hypothetical protein
MATFRVGQRVRIKRSYAWPELNGTQGTMVPRPNGVTNLGHISDTGLSCAPDAWGSKFHPTEVNEFGGTVSFEPDAEQLEPIVDDGRQVITWDACCWQPSHEGVPA